MKTVWFHPLPKYKEAIRFFGWLLCILINLFNQVNIGQPSRRGKWYAVKCYKGTIISTTTTLKGLMLAAAVQPLQGCVQCCRFCPPVSPKAIQIEALRASD